MSQGSDDTKLSDIRSAAKRALQQLLEPLAGFALDSGLSVDEVRSLFRDAAVRSAASRQLEISARINISGIAATTGISRADISKILRMPAAAPATSSDVRQQATNRTLSAWHGDPKFTGPNGQPADLKVYGRAPSFEALVRRYGRGIPARAVLDELIRTGAVEMLSTQKVRAKASVAVERGMSEIVIKAFGDRATELLSTMLLNMRRPDAPRFIASVAGAPILSSALPLFRKELSIKGADFLADIREDLARKPMRVVKRFESEPPTISVTVFYHEAVREKNGRPAVINKRRNLRRET